MELKTLINTFSTIRATSDIKRYSRDRLTDTESVLQHIGWVSMFALFLADHLESKFAVKVDFGKLYKRLIVHDLDETITGDVPRPTKYYNESVTKVFKEVEAEGVAHIFRELQSSSDLMTQWSNAKDHTIEGVILKLADLFAVAYMCWLEILMYNNMSFIRVMRESRGYVDVLFTDIFEDKWKDIINGDAKEYLKELQRSVNRIYDECDFRANVMNVDKTSTQFFLSSIQKNG